MQSPAGRSGRSDEHQRDGTAAVAPHAMEELACSPIELPAEAAEAYQEGQAQVPMRSQRLPGRTRTTRARP